MVKDTLSEMETASRSLDDTDDTDRLTLEGDGDDHDDETEILDNADKTE